MAEFYTRAARSVDKLLARYGKACELVKQVQGGYNPDTGTVEPDSEVTYTAQAIEGGYELQHLADTLVEAGNKVGVLKVTDPAFDGEVTLALKIRLHGDKLRNLREIQPVTPGPLCLYWRFVAGP